MIPHNNSLSKMDSNDATRTVFLVLVVAFIVSKIITYQRGLKSVGYIPGFRTLFHPFSLPGVLLPLTWWNPNLKYLWEWRHKVYRRFNTDTISFVPYLAGPSTIFTSNLDVIRQIASNSTGKGFMKPSGAAEAFRQWGTNLLSADGDVWRKHRRIMGPAFNNKLYEAVWDETLRTYREMISEEGWAAKEHIDAPVLQALTFKVALLVITKCGFGFSFNWGEPVRQANGRISIQEAFRVISDSHLITVFVPKWLRKLPLRRFKELAEAEHELMEFMLQQVAERKADISSNISERKIRQTNVFSMLVEASEKEEGKLKLDDSELIGNVFILLFAGHETTAHTLAATLGFLAANDSVQAELYEEIISVVGHEREPAFNDYDKLPKVLAAFNEALRMFPSAYIMIRATERDTVLQVPNPVGQEGIKSVPLPKGSLVVADMIGAQYNPRYFENPEEYKPSRWYGESNESEFFSAFSVGARACIGQKFATAEAVAFLSALLRDYKVEPLLNEKETPKQWSDRVLDGSIRITLGVKDVPVRFVRRRRD